jgi:L-ribulose-5-phosphate 3-epimerase
MSDTLNRRQFLQQSTAMALAGSSWAATTSAASRGTSGPAASGTLKKAACIGVLPPNLSVLERFKLAKSVGFEGIEPNTLPVAEMVAEYKEASRSTGLKIPSIMNSDHWRYPLTDNDPEVVKKCVEGIRVSMRNARDLGADTVLLVPGIVTPAVRYADVYRRSQKQIRELLPLAKELNVIIAVENVGNRFLLSPLEFARYVDEFNSPLVKAYFDIGNITSIGFAPDWIRTLGKRLVKIHIKKFEPGIDQPKFDPKDNRTQGIDWPDVRKAIGEAGYAGWVTAEVKTGDENYLRSLVERMDRVFAGENPA